jgi:hypothetical protein
VKLVHLVGFIIKKLFYLTLKEEYNYAAGEENRVSGIKWGSNNKVYPADEKLGRYKSNWLRHLTTKKDRMPKLMLNYTPYGGRSLGRPLKRVLDEA